MILLLCAAALAIDGDTLRCHRPDGSAYLVRLAAIDAPELPGHCRPATIEGGHFRKARACAPGDPVASRAALQARVAARDIWCRQTGTDHYGRIVAWCSAPDAAGRAVDLSCAQVRAGAAIRWARYDQPRRLCR